MEKGKLVYTYRIGSSYDIRKAKEKNKKANIEGRAFYIKVKTEAYNDGLIDKKEYDRCMEKYNNICL